MDATLFHLAAAIGPFTGFMDSTLLALLIGIGFGIALETGGFGDSRILAAQFYFYQMRVLKVMFTAIVVAMLLVFWSVQLGFLDYAVLGVPNTHLWPGILGGLILGAGFIVGGYCPGTSLVASATGKMDGLFFLLGLGGGMVAFNHVSLDAEVWKFFQTNSNLGRVTLMDVTGWPTGYVVALVAVVALGAFHLASVAERVFAGWNPHKASSQSLPVIQDQADSSRLENEL